MPRAWKVFICSTYLDNVARRKLVEDAVLAAEMLPVGMERFVASTRPTVEECTRMAREADLLVGIVARRYGWIPDGYEKSITELEYEAQPARLMFLIDESLPFQEEDFDPEPDRWEKQRKLAEFKGRIDGDQMATRFKEPDLAMKVLQSLEAWRREREPAPVELEPVTPEPLPRDAGEIDRYLEKVAAVHESIPFAGFETKVRAPVRLEDLYVPLKARVDLRGSGIGRFWRGDEADEALREHPGDQEIQLSDAFWQADLHGRRKGIVILGDPGSGKTTHLKSMLVSLAREGPEKLALPEGMVPVFLPFRVLDSVPTNLPEFIDDALAACRVDLGPGFGRKLADRGKLLFLLDGLDEVADAADREKAARWIEEVLAAHPASRFVVTCRYAGYDEDVRLNEQFLEMHLRPLDTGQAEDFVRRWFRTVETGLDADKDRAERKAEDAAGELLKRLREPDFRAARVFALTRNPLLLTAICLVHRDRGRLPHRRAELYDECVNVLLERWREAKKLDVTVGATEARAVLQPVAYWLHQEIGRKQASEDSLVPIITPALPRIEGSGGGAREFLRTIRDQSGLLTGFGGDSYGFLHLGFQEYLAARDVFSRAMNEEWAALRELAERFGESWWDEVILLLLGLRDASVFDPFFRRVVEQPGFLTRPDLVDLCLSDSPQKSAAPFVEAIEDGENAVSQEVRTAALRVLRAHWPETAEVLAPTLGLISPLAGLVHTSPQGGYGLVTIPGGTFDMGSPATEEGRNEAEGPVHPVTVPSFSLGQHPVTNEEYALFLEANQLRLEPGFWADSRYNQPRQPVVGVSWYMACTYCEWAGLRLPSEAEWEYACRAGARTRYWSGDAKEDLARVGWYDENSGDLHAVGEKPPNPLGLLDMHGNVFEWCEDHWHDSYAAAPADGTAWTEGESSSTRDRVIRGGSFGDTARRARSAYRDKDHGDLRGDNVGFRPARSVTP